MTNEWIKLGNITKFRENEAIAVDTEKFGTIVVIFQNHKYHVLSGICTHEEFELEGAPVQENQITCTLHMSAFDLTTGDVLSPPAEESLKVYETKIEENNLYIR